jgi:hypothetical protein
VESKQDAAGTIEIKDAALIEVTNGGEISAFVTNVKLRGDEQPADLASDIRIVNADSVRLDHGTMNAQTNGNAVGGTIDIEATSIESIDSTLTARTLSSGAGGAINIDARNVRMDGGTVTAATTAAGAGGQIAFVNVDDVLITGGAEVTSKSTSDTNGGRAGTITISANDSFQIDQGSKITTTTEDANGGGISIQAGELVYLLDAIVKSDIKVKSGQPDAGAGNIFIPFNPDAPNAGPPPDFVVINRSTVSANASGTGADGGDITIAGREVMISTDSVISATASDPTGVSGNIQITAPDSDVVSQLTPLATTFVDASDRLLPPCIARTERTGSFIVQNRAATLPSPDSPLSAGLGTAAGAGGTSPSDSVECSVFEEKI